MTKFSLWFALLLLGLGLLACGNDDDDDTVADDDDTFIDDDDDDTDGPPPLATCPIPDFTTETEYTVQTLTYDTEGGVDIVGDLYLPVDPPGPVSAIMLIHGGGWVQNDRTLMDLPADYYASKGMAVWNIDYRLIDGTLKMDALVRDCSCALRWLEANAQDYGIVPGCTGVLGESAGGHLTAMLALAGDRPEAMAGCEAASDVQPFVRYAMPYYGVFDVDAMVAQYGEVILGIFFGDNLNSNDYAPADLVEAKPLLPFFVAVGTADTLVEPSQSTGFAAALETAGHPTTLVVVDDAPHGFVAGGFEGESNAVAQPRAEEFIRQYLRGPGDGPPPGNGPPPGE